MPNSMDCILVKYGVSFTKEEQELLDHSYMDEEGAKKLTAKIKTAPISEFLSLNPKNLSETEQKIQKALKLVYDLNGKKPPLYHQFPTFWADTNPLTIDITKTGTVDGQFAAAYVQLKNMVIFKDVDDLHFLVLTLSHELKHAEQNDEKSYQQTKQIVESAFTGIPVKSPYAWHQVQFLSEAQAFATNARAYYEIFGHTDDPRMTGVKTYEQISKKYTNAFGHKNDQKIEEEMIRFTLDKVYNSPYKDAYDMQAPIGDKDVGLDRIPDSFHLSQDLMDKVNECPRKARNLKGQLLQARRNNHMADYIALLHQGIEKSISIGMGDVDYVLKNADTQQLQEILALKKTDSEYLFEVQEIRNSFIKGFCINPESLRYFLTVKRDNERIIRAKEFGEMLGLLAQNPNEFKKCVQTLTDDKGFLPISEKDVVGEDRASGRTWNDLLGHFDPFTQAGLDVVVQMIPEIMKLKGQDGKPLVSQKHLSAQYQEWSKYVKIPNDLKNIMLGNRAKGIKGKSMLARRLIQESHKDSAVLAKKKKGLGLG